MRIQLLSGTYYIPLSIDHSSHYNRPWPLDLALRTREGFLGHALEAPLQEFEMASVVNEPLSRHALAFVLAGGRGTRLLELTERRAKPAVYFGGKSRIIDFALSNAVNSGIRRIAVATQYKAHSLIRHLQMGWNFFRPERMRASISCPRVSASRRRTGILARPTLFIRT
jgi:glucose-1-phosphate adenylyltransferase